MNISPLSSQPFNDYSQLNNYNDLNSLQSLKRASDTDKEGAMDAVAKHFESIFVSMMIKGMRDANKVFSEGNLLQSTQSDFYQQMYDSQLAVSLSTSKGIGLAEVIKRQLSAGIQPDYKVEKGGLSLNTDIEPKTYSLENYARKPFVSRLEVKELEDTVKKIDKTLAHLPDQKPLPAIERLPALDQSFSLDQLPEQGRVSLKENTPVDFSSPDNFITSLYPFAKQVEQQTGIDARLMLAQSALETGWGQHQILKEDGSPSFNLFGIKAQAGWQGKAADITTTEYRQGVAMKERASFRAYDSYSESFQDYANFLKTNNRYQKAMQHSDNPKVFAEQLQNAGYATDPQYANKISRIVDGYLWSGDRGSSDERVPDERSTQGE